MNFSHLHLLLNSNSIFSKVHEIFCQDCKLEFCQDCSKIVHGLKAFCHHRLENHENIQHLSITNLTQTSGKTTNEKNSDVWINPNDFKLYQVLSNVGAESKVKKNIKQKI